MRLRPFLGLSLLMIGLVVFVAWMAYPATLPEQQVIGNTIIIRQELTPLFYLQMAWDGIWILVIAGAGTYGILKSHRILVAPGIIALLALAAVHSFHLWYAAALAVLPMIAIQVVATLLLDRDKPLLG